MLALPHFALLMEEDQVASNPAREGQMSLSTHPAQFGFRAVHT